MSQHIDEIENKSYEANCVLACELLPIQIFIFDVPTKSLVWSNKQTLDFYGLPAEELYPNWSRIFPSYLHPDDVGIIDKTLTRISKEDLQSTATVLRSYDVNKQLHWFHDQGVLLKKDPEREDHKWIFMRQNITQHDDYKETLVALNKEVILLQHQAKLAGLTKREIEIIRLVGTGRSNKKIATEIGISDRTVETHRKNLLRKLHLRGTAELVRFAIENGLL